MPPKLAARGKKAVSRLTRAQVARNDAAAAAGLLENQSLLDAPVPQVSTPAHVSQILSHSLIDFDPISHSTVRFSVAAKKSSLKKPRKSAKDTNNLNLNKKDKTNADV